MIPFILQLIVISMSPRERHPYSWSAICNGDQSLMEDCGFPVIPRYLEAIISMTLFRMLRLLMFGLKTGSNEHIAQTCKSFIASEFSELVGSVDAVFLARMMLKIIFTMQGRF